MFVSSIFSVCAGGSLGPEAPLLCLCASTAAYTFQRLFPVRQRMLRYCSMLGMSAGLAAFFGVSMGGAPHRLEQKTLAVGSLQLTGGDGFWLEASLCMSVSCKLAQSI